MSAGEASQVLVGFGALVAFLTGFSALRQRQRLEYIRESVRTANERLEDLAERQDALPLPATAIRQELRPASTDPLGALVISLSVLTAGAVSSIWWRAAQEGVFSEQLTAGLLSALAVALIVVTSGVGVFDVLWGRRQIRMALQHSTARHAAAMLLRFFIIGRLILVQQLHRSLVMRLDPADANGTSRDAEILRRITQLPDLLGGAGVPPWILANARRRAVQSMNSSLAANELPHRAGLEELEVEATRASLVLRQLRPSTETWQRFCEAAEDLRGRLPEWEWVDLFAAWIATGLITASSSGEDASGAQARSRLDHIDYQRALGIHSTTRETDSRDLAAWTIADAIERRAVLVGAVNRNAVSGTRSPWDIFDTESGSAPQERPVSRTSVNGFRSRDPFIWLALTQPSVFAAADWVGDHIVIDDGVRWRRSDEGEQVQSWTAAVLATSPGTHSEIPRELDGSLTARVFGHSINDANPLIAMRTSGARDISQLFRRYLMTDSTKSQKQWPPPAALVEYVLSPLRWLGTLSRRMPAAMALIAAVIIVLLLAR